MLHRTVSVTGILLASAAVLALLNGCQTPRKETEPMSKFVRVELRDGRYWFVRGNEQFLSLGVNVVEPEDGTRSKDGRYYNVLPKYSNDLSRWAADATARLKTWNFTTVAAWSHEYLYNHVPMYHTRVVWFGPWGNRDSRLIDVFSEKYAAEIEKTALEQVAPYATNEYLIGFFANNELPWYGEKGWPSDPNISLLSRYMGLPSLAPGKLKVIEFLREFYQNDFTALQADWTVEAAGFDELPAVRRILPAGRASRKAVVAWSGIVAEEYYRLCAEALHRHAPNHLFLGSRFAERAYEPIMKACGKYADVVSVNHYRKTGIFDHRQVGAIHALCQKPILVTEFSWRAMENSSECKNTKGADVTVQTQADRARCFRSYSTNLLQQPFMLGYDWFMYHDQPPSGRFDGEDSNYGLVDNHDQIYGELTSALAEINAQADDLHRQSNIPLPAYDPLILADYREITLRGAGHPLPAPILFATADSTHALWGDYANGAKITADAAGSEELRISVHPGKGWGCGISFSPTKDLEAREDGSVSLLGAQKVIVELSAPKGVKISLGVNESGHGPLESQTFRGYGESDGEAWSYPAITVSEGQGELVFDLSKLDNSTSHGNQRGNKIVDMDAVATMHLYFPGGQSPFDFTLKSIRVE